jgi:hypothetical protein
MLIVTLDTQWFLMMNPAKSAITYYLGLKKNAGTIEKALVN